MTREKAPHGTYARYSANPNGCHCDECKAAKRKYMRDKRAEEKAKADPNYYEEEGAA